ncbi:unnamed protein product [Pocillopora meandrina]|uniref:G-protein coupled receptors family 1 profile domain-containing protein n=1 Tax=Pocillopora meandrina TaxID=46732 RepID=A0AAU9X5Z9_9CNID|nr:unnamed protein product [Pocillopora meandrina]
MSLFTDTEAAEISLRVAFSFLVLISLVSNSLVCLVVLRNRLMRSAMNYLLVNLACADSYICDPSVYPNSHVPTPDGAHRGLPLQVPNRREPVMDRGRGLGGVTDCCCS